MKDFTFSTYQRLIDTLKTTGYFIYPNSSSPHLYHKLIILRHDIDAKPSNALIIATLENMTGVKSSFFFKIEPEVFIHSIVQQIASLGHEIGYHYEDLVKNHGNYKKAISDFERNLDSLRKVFPVTTICADGEPLSKFNNLWLWEKYDYKRFGITCEVYLDIDYNEHAYFTDTGRCWDGDKYNVWDHVKTKQHWPRYHSTAEIIKAIENNTFPNKVAINIHPQRWNENPWAWTKELLLQNTKNVVKQGLLAIKKSNPSH